MPTRRNPKRWAPYKSGLEHAVADAIRTVFDEEPVYELHSFRWYEKLPRGYCTDCGLKNVIADRTYTPDFWLPNGTIIEVKGRFTEKDRKIAAAMKELYPEQRMVYLFQYDNKLTTKSQTRYKQWCDKLGVASALKADLPNILQEWGYADGERDMTKGMRKPV